MIAAGILIQVMLAGLFMSRTVGARMIHLMLGAARGHPLRAFPLPGPRHGTRSGSVNPVSSPERRDPSHATY